MMDEMGKQRDSILENRRASPVPQNGAALAGAVRLDEAERSKLAAVFGTHLRAYPDAVVRLFGSRIHPGERGGDIDLLVISREAAGREYDLSKKLRVAIKEQLGEQKIDVLVSPDPYTSDQPAFMRIVLRESVQIWP